MGCTTPLLSPPPVGGGCLDDWEVAQELDRLLSSDPETVGLTLVGVGGAGINLLRHVPADAAARKVAMDTDDVFLALSRTEDQLCLGASLLEGTGAQGRPELGQAAAHLQREAIAEVLEGDILLLVAGLGRGTGTGATPVVAEVGRERGMVILAFVLWPFPEEGVDAVAAEGLQALRARCEGHAVLDNGSVRGADQTHWEAAQRVNEAAAGVVVDLVNRVLGSLPLGVPEAVASFWSELAANPEELPLRSADWTGRWESVPPLATDPRGFISLR